MYHIRLPSATTIDHYRHINHTMVCYMGRHHQHSNSHCWVTKHPRRIHYTTEGEEYIVL